MCVYMCVYVVCVGMYVCMYVCAYVCMYMNMTSHLGGGLTFQKYLQLFVCCLKLIRNRYQMNGGLGHDSARKAILGRGQNGLMI